MGSQMLEPSFVTPYFLLFGSRLIMQKQPSRGGLSKRCSENMQQIYRTFLEHLSLRSPLSGCFLLHIWRKQTGAVVQSHPAKAMFKKFENVTGKHVY